MNNGFLSLSLACAASAEDEAFEAEDSHKSLDMMKAISDRESTVEANIKSSTLS